MNSPDPLTRKILISVSLFILFSFFLPAQHSGAALKLDEDAVFCSYFMISGDQPSEQDVEELCFAEGRPPYTSYKPSEMFSKKSLLSEKNRIKNRLVSISGDPTFIWNVKLNAMDAATIGQFLSAEVINKYMPRPTPYISGRISVNGQKYIKNSLKVLLDGAPSKKYGKGLEILISLRPVNSSCEYEKRNIVEQEVILPIRYVIFQPIKVQILDGNRLNN